MYLHRDEVISMINDALFSCLMTPIFQGKKVDGTMMNLTEISANNSMISIHNEGAREMAERLKEKLRERDQDD